MSFYTDLSEYYDEVFPVSADMKTFLKEKVNGTILSLGCATGGVELALSENQNLDLTGIDLNEKMIALALKKAGNKPNVHFMIGDMTKLEEQFPQEQFDSILCLGNTLSHLDDINQVKAFIRSVKKILKPRGSFITQIMNYDKIIHDMVMNFPPVKTQKVLFERFYRFVENKILFTTKITDLKTGKVYTNAINLYPILSEQLTTFMKECGFETFKLYGAYNGEPYSSQYSYHTIIYAR